MRQLIHLKSRCLRKLCSRNELPGVSWVRSAKTADTSQQTQCQARGGRISGEGTGPSMCSRQHRPVLSAAITELQMLLPVLPSLICAPISLLTLSLEILPEEQLTRDKNPQNTLHGKFGIDPTWYKPIFALSRANKREGKRQPQQQLCPSDSDPAVSRAGAAALPLFLGCL